METPAPCIAAQPAFSRERALRIKSLDTIKIIIETFFRRTILVKTFFPLLLNRILYMYILCIRILADKGLILQSIFPNVQFLWVYIIAAA